jgi:hypothetical protein
MPSRKWTDLAIVSLLAIIASIATLSPSTYGAFSQLFALPLVFVLPGYALNAALFSKTEWGFPETVTWSVGSSLVVDILSGLVINMIPLGMGPLSWGLFLGGVTLVASVVALFRRNRRFSQKTPLKLQLAPGQALLLGLSIVATISAYAIAGGWAAVPQTYFSELWVLSGTQGNQEMLNLGVRNMEAGKTEYRVEIQAGGQVLYDWPSIALAQGQSWEAVVARPTHNLGNEIVSLYRNDDPNHVYREVSLSRSQ